MTQNADTSQEKSARPLTVEESHSNAIDIVRGEEIIASIINDDGEVTDEMRAYAALFAAAPDMLRELRLAERNTKILVEMLRGERRKEKAEINAADEQRETFNAAIAKAEKL